VPPWSPKKSEEKGFVCTMSIIISSKLKTKSLSPNYVFFFFLS
jgi:hypothetical protein